MNTSALEHYMKDRGELWPVAKIGEICKFSRSNASHKLKVGNFKLHECCQIAKYYGMDLYDFVRIFLDDVYELEE